MVARSRSVPSLVGALVLASCSSTPAPTEVPVTLRPVPSASAAPTEPAPIALRPRASSDGLVARVRTSELSRARDLVARVVPTASIDELGEELGLDRGVLGAPDAAAKLGLDPDGVVTFESFELDERAASLVERMRALRDDVSDQSLGAALLDAYQADPRTGWFLTRARASVRRAALSDLAERALVRRGAKRVPIAEGDTAYTLGHAVWHVKSEPGAVTVELALSDKPTDARDVRGALAALGAWSPTTSPELAPTENLVVRMRPSSVVTAGLLLGAQRLGELAPSMEPEQIESLASRVLRDQKVLTGIDAPDGVPRYASVVLTETSTSATLTSTLDAKVEAFRSDDWRDAGGDVVVDGAMLDVTVNGALLYGWKLIPSKEGINPYYSKDVARANDRAGFPAELVLAGEAPFLLARAGMEDAEAIGQATLPWMRKWERLGVAVMPRQGRGATSVFVGLLPASVTEDEAACALSRVDAACPTAERIKPKVVTYKNGYSVTRKKVDGRWVVIASRDEGLTKSATVHVTTGARPAYVGGIDPAVLGRELGLGGTLPLPKLHARATRSPDGRSYTLDLRP